MSKGRFIDRDAVIPIGTHQNVVVNGVVDLIAPPEATVLYIQAYGSDVRITLDDGETTPTLTTGFFLGVNGDILRLSSFSEITYKLIGSGAGVNVQWFKTLADV